MCRFVSLGSCLFIDFTVILHLYGHSGLFVVILFPFIVILSVSVFVLHLFNVVLCLFEVDFEVSSRFMFPHPCFACLQSFFVYLELFVSLGGLLQLFCIFVFMSCCSHFKCLCVCFASLCHSARLH